MKTAEFSHAFNQVHKPSKVALAVTQKLDGSYNLITLEWFMRTSIRPPMFAISIGNSRYSYRCLEANPFFNLVFPTSEMKELCKAAGSTTGAEVDKFELNKVEYIDGKLKGFPVLTQAKAVFECEVVTQVRSGDHTIYVGQVKHSWLNDEGDILLIQ
ncbi:MAG: flavin reductase family protein [Candidatus Cloacimonadaceae bacterium]|jgi:flavin reductase (DIM6/NTAB) family NADH-FMN oxidoreductase RutF